MCKIKDNLLKNIHSLIEKKKENYDDLNIVDHGDGMIIQYFDSWDDFISDTKTKEVRKIGDYSENKNVLMIFAKKGTLVPITDFECSKTYVFLTGKIRLFFENKEDIMIEGISTMECDIPHGGEVFEDSYFIVVDEY
jgi:hypothetical protein